ncbi:MAG: diguanylate cyclase (GGDEF)-like protein [Candidatus Endobugula sp.]|jgi:diguanylate cyclase (GGDEF)-like protein
MTEVSQKILLVDDDETDRMVVRRALAKFNKKVTVVEATRFSEAVELLKENEFNCILLEYRLGGIDGIDIVKKIHSEGLSDAPIIMFSGMDDEAIMLNCLKEGAQDFLLKSEITTHSLMRAIRYAEERKNITLQISYLAKYDSLTDLSNRSLFIENVERAVTRSKRANAIFAIIFIDLDNFKSINDTLGHEAGDQLLVTIAKRLKSSLREEDVVGRLGGDEFAVLIEGIATETFLIKISQKLLDVTREPLIIEDKIIHSTASLGIATYPSCADECTALIKCADLAMYKTKENGRNGYSFYSDDLQTLADDYATLKCDIHDALSRDEFELYYQPQVNATDSTITGLEALIRWHHPTRGMVPPDKFIPIAESLGLINEIGDWVMEAACRQLKVWISSCPHLQHDFRVAVNISAHQMRQLNLKEKFCHVLDNNTIPYGLIELELTESALVDDLGRCTETLSVMNDLGIHFAIDDFGTGFASFRHLQQLPLQVLKVDKSFIDQICLSSKSYQIVKAMIVMAHALEMKVIAEGVETMEQVNLLQTLDCDHLQGYHFWKPMPAHDIEKLLADPKYRAQTEMPTMLDSEIM